MTKDEKDLQSWLLSTKLNRREFPSLEHLRYAKTSTQSWLQTLIFTLVAIVCLSPQAWVVYNTYSYRFDAIHPHESGQAVYIEQTWLTQGSCTINAHEDVSLVEFNDMMVWCSVQHMAYLSELK